MIWLILSIISSVLLYVGLKYAGNRNMNSLHLIFFNYITPFLLGWLLQGEFISSFSKPWIWHALILGLSIFFVIILLSYTTKYMGVTITSLAHKVSMIIPIVMAVFLYGERMSMLKIAGIICALLGLVLTIYKPSNQSLSFKYLGFLFLIFLIPGFNDTFIKYIEHHYLNGDAALFVTVMYFFSLCATAVYIAFTQRVVVQSNVVWTGLLLGFANFGGMYFFFLALDEIPDSSIVISLNNVGTILLSVAVAYFVFHEKLSKLNLMGISLSALAVYILTYI